MASQASTACRYVSAASGDNPAHCNGVRRWMRKTGGRLLRGGRQPAPRQVRHRPIGVVAVGQSLGHQIFGLEILAVGLPAQLEHPVQVHQGGRGHQAQHHFEGLHRARQSNRVHGPWLARRHRVPSQLAIARSLRIPPSGRVLLRNADVIAATRVDAHEIPPNEVEERPVRAGLASAPTLRARGCRSHHGLGEARKSRMSRSCDGPSNRTIAADVAKPFGRGSPVQMLKLFMPGSVTRAWHRSRVRRTIPVCTVGLRYHHKPQRQHPRPSASVTEVVGNPDDGGPRMRAAERLVCVPATGNATRDRKLASVTTVRAACGGGGGMPAVRCRRSSGRGRSTGTRRCSPYLPAQ